MKKIFLVAALFAASITSVNADTDVTIPSVETAQANGWDALWGDYQWGYVMPENHMLVDNEEITVQLNRAANVATSCQVAGYDINLQMGSSLTRESNTPIYSLETLYATMKQPYAVLTVTPKMNGKLTYTYCRGKNGNTTMYVWDTSAADGVGAYVSANSTFFDETEDADLDPIAHTVTVNLRKDHVYYVFGAEEGANTDFYGMKFVPYSSPNYVTSTTGTTEMVIPTVETAQANNWGGLWGDYQWGYVMPENHVLVDNEDIKLQLNRAANVATSCQVAGYGINLQMGSSITRESNTPIYSLETLYATMKQPYAVLTLTPKKNGKITFTYCRGKNGATTMYVWDTSAADGVGAYVCANSTFFDETQDASLEILPHTVTVNVRKDHVYWIFGAEEGANTDFYSLAFTGYHDANYSTSTGIENVVTNTTEKPADNKIYTIDGRYVGTDKAALVKGLYIQNGKKFIVK